MSTGKLCGEAHEMAAGKAGCIKVKKGPISAATMEARDEQV